MKLTKPRQLLPCGLYPGDAVLPGAVPRALVPDVGGGDGGEAVIVSAQQDAQVQGEDGPELPRQARGQEGRQLHGNWC